LVSDITLDFLTQNGIINKNDLVKVLGGGELSIKLSVSVHKCTESAKEKIEKAGGTVTLV
jgi:large subunit ribosomal protein L15